jgi:O-antigen ligase
VDRAERLGRLRAVGAFLVGLTIPISTSISEIVTGIAFLALLAEWQPRENWQRIRGNPVVWASLGLYLLLGLGMFYSAAPFPEALHIWIKYHELAYLPLFLLLCRDRRAARLGLLGLLAALGAIFCLGMFQSLTHVRLPFLHYGNSGVFGSYIIEGVLMALGAYILAVEAILNPRLRIAAATAAVLALYYVLFVSFGRTGFVVAVALGVLLMVQALPRKWLLPGLLLLAFAAGSVFLLSSVVGSRMMGVVASLQGTEDDAASNSAGARLRFYRGSLVVIARHPIFGTGTGSFNLVYNDQAAIDNHAVTSNPHNEYLMIGVQTGIVGVAALLALLATLWIQAGGLPQADAWRARAVTLALALSCLFNSSLLDHVDGQSFAFLIGLFYFGAHGREDQRRHNDL